MSRRESAVIGVSVIRYLVVCRVHREPVWLVLPCNWVRRGFCGCDARPCDLEVLEVES